MGNQVRSDWIKVVGDLDDENISYDASLNGERHEKKTNEVNHGFLNMLRVVQKITGIEFYFA
jgi:hypothetical protein